MCRGRKKQGTANSARSSSTGASSELEAPQRSAWQKAQQKQKLSQMVDLFQNTLTRLQSNSDVVAVRRATLEAAISLVCHFLVA